MAGAVPLICIRVYCGKSELKNPKIINKLIITRETAAMADHAVKFSALDRRTGNERVFIACFKNAILGGIYLTSVKELGVDNK